MYLVGWWVVGDARQRQRVQYGLLFVLRQMNAIKVVLFGAVRHLHIQSQPFIMAHAKSKLIKLHTAYFHIFATQVQSH